MSVPTPLSRLASFDTLAAREVYELLRLRSEVFVVEQNCVYQDLDRRDFDAMHLLVSQSERLVGYARILAPGVLRAGVASVGRVVTAEQVRGTGLGHRIVHEATVECGVLYPDSEILIHAQSHLVGFYARHGYCTEGEEFHEDGIPHRLMRRTGPD